MNCSHSRASAAASARAPGDRSLSPAFDPEALTRLVQRSRADRKTGCLIWQRQITRQGYGRIGFRRRTWLAHRLAWFAHRGPIPKGLFVCHSCDNRRCIAIDHLFVGTAQQNSDDMILKSRGRWRSRLQAKQVVDVKSRLVRGEMSCDIAKRYGVSSATIYAIKSGKNWKHVEPTGVLPEGRARRRPSDDRIPIVEFQRAE